MKRILTLLSLLSVTSFAFGQRLSISAGPELAVPTSQKTTFKRDAGTGFGGSVRFEYLTKGHFSLIATGGYISFAGTSIPAHEPLGPSSTKLHAIPVQVGAKYYLRKLNSIPSGMFFSLEGGLIYSNGAYWSAIYINRILKETTLSIAPGVGYRFKKFEASVRSQNSITSSKQAPSYLSFRLAYSF